MQRESTPVQETRFFRIAYSADRQETLLTFLPSTADMDEEGHKANINAVSAFMQQHSAPNMLMDCRQFLFTVTPEVQEWLATEVAPVWYATGLRKLALLMPKDFFSNLSLEQTAEEVETAGQGQSYEHGYFSEIDAARKWLHAD